MPCPKSNWENAVNQLVRRKILQKGTVLDPPRMRPKKVRSVELIAGTKQIHSAANQLGRKNKQADLISYLANSPDPLPAYDTVQQATNSSKKQIDSLVDAGILHLPTG